MGELSSIPREKWVRFLKSIGLCHIRSKGSHEIWDRDGKKLTRPIVFRKKDRMIPKTHVQTCLRTLEMSREEFLERIRDV